jgi:hypothetical protein
VDSEGTHSAAELLAAVAVGIVLFILAPGLSPVILAAAFAALLATSMVIQDLRRPMTPARRLYRSCASCIIVLAFAPWRIVGALVCLGLFAVMVLVVRRRPDSIPRLGLWLAPLVPALAVLLVR